MKRIQKSSVRDEVYKALRQECLSGKWETKLPGTRVLAANLGVSAPTVLKVLAELAHEGILIRLGDKKAYQINPNSRILLKNKPKNGKKCVLILSPSPVEDMVVTTRRVVELLKDAILKKKWDFKEQVIDYNNAKSVHKSWDQMIEVDPKTPIIAVYGKPVIAQWAAQNKMRILFIGGVTDEHATMVAVSSSNIAAKAIDSLIALGHRHIALPLHDRAESLRKSVRAEMKPRIESLGEVYQPNYHNPSSAHFNRETVQRMVMGYSRSTMPTAFIFLDWREFITATSCFAQLGLKVPQDISVILLNDQLEAGWYLPEITRYTFPLEQFVKSISAWISDVSAKPQEIILSPRRIEGESIAPPSR